MHKNVRGARRMNAHARRTPEMRRARWTNARHTRGTRGAHAGHALCVRRVSSDAHLAHRERTPSVLLTHAQRSRRSSSVFLACGRELYKHVPPHPLITYPSALIRDDIDSCWSCVEELYQNMDDPDRLRIQYEIAVLQHQQDLVELALHQVDVIRRRRKRKGHRRFWVRPWIGRRRQFGRYDQLLVELRNEDQASFKDFMRMPPDMFDELLTRMGPRITKHTANYKETLDPGLKLALTLRHITSETKYHSTSYGWRVRHNTISLFIPKVCQAIIDEYKDEVMKCPTTPEEWRAISSDKFAKR